MDLVYLVLLTLAAPFLAVKRWRTGKPIAGFRAKFSGHMPTVPGHPAWFHAVSVGEAALLAPLLAGFRSRHPTIPILVTTTTATGYAEARKRYPDLTVAFFPFDFSWAVKRALITLQPCVIVLAESELWPNFLKHAERRSIPVVVVNGRLSPRSGRRWKRIAPLARRLLFGRVTRFGMQSPGYAQAVLDLGVDPERVCVTGNVKYDGALRPVDGVEPLRTRYAPLLPGLVWLAGSTHAPEEAIVLAAYARLRSRFPTLGLILVPRSPERFGVVADLIAAMNIPWIRRSDTGVVPSHAGILLVDTIGELAGCWHLADVGFTGGSFDGARGGQSMIEPAAIGVPTVFGPHVWNFRDAVERLTTAGGAKKVATPEALEAAVADWLGDDAARRQAGEAARAVVAAEQGAAERTLDLIDSVLPASFLRRAA